MSTYINGVIVSPKDSYWQYRKTGNYHGNGITESDISANVTINTLYAVPFITPNTNITVTAIATSVAVAAGAGKLQRLGIYNDNGSYAPGTLLLDAGAFLCDSTGLKEITALSTVLNANSLYWLAILSDGTAQNASVYALDVLALLGASTSFVTLEGSYTVVQAYGALPNPFTAGFAAISNTCPKIGVKWS